MQPLQISVPQVVKVVKVFGHGIVGDKQAQLLCELTLSETHLPIGLWLFFVDPLQPYVAVLLSFHNPGEQCVVLTVWTAPCQAQHSLVLYDTVSKPQLQTMVCAQQAPKQIWLARV